MKVVFAGPSLARPSLAGAHRIQESDIEFRAPAIQGDVVRAVEEGAAVIGLIDGQFENVAPVWHKELLYALKAGVTVLGASSMGALRAAECQDFGMRGIGQISYDYASGRRFDDADVALLHGPAELGYAPITVPLVNMDATLEKAVDEGLVDEEEAGHLHQAARRIFYKDRTWRGISSAAGMPWPRFSELVERCWTDQKLADALALVDAINQAPERPASSPPEWSFNATPLWRELYDKSVKSSRCK